MASIAIDTEFTGAELLGLAGAGIVLIAALVPWIQAGMLDVAGYESLDGRATLFLAVVLVLLLLIRPPDALNVGALVVGGAAVVAVGLYVYLRPMHLLTAAVARLTPRQLVQPEIGLYLTLLGGAVLVVAGVLGYLDVARGPGRDIDPELLEDW